MKRLVLAIAALASLGPMVPVVSAQFFGGPARRIITGTTPPATCQVGDVFVDTDADPGDKFLKCETANTWSSMSAAAGALDADLTAIAALSCAEGEIIKRGALAWECGTDETGGAGSDINGMAPSRSSATTLTVSSGGWRIGGLPGANTFTSGDITKSSGSGAVLWCLGTDQVYVGATGTLDVSVPAGTNDLGIVTACPDNTVEWWRWNADDNGTDFDATQGSGNDKRYSVASPVPCPVIDGDSGTRNAVTGACEYSGVGGGVSELVGQVWITPELSVNSGVANSVLTVDRVYAFKKCTVAPLTFSKAWIHVGTNLGGNWAVGVYSLDGSTKLIDTGATAVAGTNSQTDTFTPVTLSAGCYLVAFTTDDADTTFGTLTSNSTFWASFGNADSDAIMAGFQNTASTGAVLPASLTLSSVVGAQALPVVMLTN